MKVLNTDIRIGNYVFHWVNQLSVSSSIESLTKTCKIVIPRKVEWKGKKIAIGEESLLKAGYKVTAKAGYDADATYSNLPVVFSGYLKKIAQGNRVELQCEDQMYLLKQNNVTKTYTAQTTLKQFLNDVLPAGVQFDAVDMLLGEIRLNNVTAAKALEYLKDNYGLYSYFKAGKLLVGLAYNSAYASRKNFKLHLLDPDWTEDLEFSSADDVKVKVKAVAIYPDNSKKTIEFGDADGDLRTFHFYNVPESDLKTLAEEELKKLKYDGYRGSIMAFGEPYIEIGDVAVLKDERYPEREGSYLVEEVDYVFGTRGIRQKINLGPKV